jgi:signal peptidase II
VNNAARAGALAAAVIAVDQGLKALVRANVDRGSSDPILPGVELVNSRNTGVAFGFFEGGGAVIALVTAGALAALLVFFYFNRARPGVWVPTGLLLGGAIGNLLDRVVRDDGVTDFIKLPVWPAFNIADMAITFGVLALVYVLEKPRDRPA